MILTVTLHCSGQQDYGCTSALSVGYHEAGHWGASLIRHAINTGWTTVAPGDIPSGEPSHAFCASCAARRSNGTTSRHQPLVDLLSLVCVTVTEDEVAAWTPTMRMQAEQWAGLEHLSASDNPVRRAPKPEFLP